MKHILYVSILLFFISGCGGGGSGNSLENHDQNTPIGDHDNNAKHFSKLIIDGDTVIIDNNKNLIWVDSKGKNGRACAPIKVTTPIEVTESATDRCDALDFAGYSEWRVPTPKELSEYIVSMKEEGKIPYYLIQNTCPRVLALQDGSPKAVSTHNQGINAGKISVLPNAGKHIGIKCVHYLK